MNAFLRREVNFKFGFLISSFFFFFFFSSFFSSRTFAMSPSACFWTTLGEYAVPGLGYGISGQWERALVFGGSRWALDIQANRARNSDYYQKDSETIYQVKSSDESQSGKTETVIRMNQETWEAKTYGGISSKMGMMSVWDLQEHDCDPDPENKVYDYSLAPFQITHFYKKWQFWAPIGFALAGYSSFNEYNKLDWYTYRGLTKSRIELGAFPDMYATGVGEEMLFRGVAQKSLFQFYQEYFSPSVSRHLAIFSAATIFGIAHDGTGGSASPATAFAYGVYLGYTYQPSLDEFDLTTVIAIHAWWDLIVYYNWIHHAEFHEEEGNAPEVAIPILNVGFKF